MVSRGPSRGRSRDGRPQVGETSWRVGERPVGLCRFRQRDLGGRGCGTAGVERPGSNGRSPCTLRPVGGHGGRGPWELDTRNRDGRPVAPSLRPVGHTRTVPGGGDRPWDFAVLKLERGTGTGGWDRPSLKDQLVTIRYPGCRDGRPGSGSLGSGDRPPLETSWWAGGRCGTCRLSQDSGSGDGRLGPSHPKRPVGHDQIPRQGRPAGIWESRIGRLGPSHPGKPVGQGTTTGPSPPIWPPAPF